MGPGHREHAVLAIGLALLVLTSGCSALLGEDSGGELVWRTPRPTPASPTATPTLGVDDAIALTRSHNATLYNRSYRLSARAVTRRNGTVVGSSTVAVDWRPGKVQYRHELEGDPAVVLGVRFFRRSRLETFAMYGEGSVVHYRAVTGYNRTTVRRVRNVTRAGEVGEPLTAREVWGPFLTLRSHLYEVLTTVAAVTSVVPTPAEAGYGFEVEALELDHQFSLGRGTVLRFESLSATVEDGVITRFNATYVLKDGDTTYTVTERVAVDYPAEFEAPGWVPDEPATANRTATPASEPATATTGTVTAAPEIAGPTRGG